MIVCSNAQIVDCVADIKTTPTKSSTDCDLIFPLISLWSDQRNVINKKGYDKFVKNSIILLIVDPDFADGNKIADSL